MPSFDDDDLVGLSAIEHYSYCPRQCALIYVAQIYEESVHTLQGTHLHERADLPLATAQAGARVERALPLWSDRLGLAGRADTVEFRADGTVRPVEYKRGERAPRRHDDLQLCAQALCLEEMLGVKVPAGAIFYHASRRTREVVFDDALRRETLQAIGEVREMLRGGRLPPPVGDARCRNCSLNAVCVPEVLRAAAEDDPAALFVPAEDEEEGE